MSSINRSSKVSVSIGIPAFNEEANIAFLIKDLLIQKLKTIKLKEIIIVSDGSTDQTVAIARKVKVRKSVSFKIVANKLRKGRAVRQNEIMKMATADVLILLDADVLIKDTLFLEKLISPILRNKADLSSAKVLELEDHSLLGKVLTASMNFKRQLFESVNNGNNLYTCHGRARAFSKNLYKKIVFKESVGEDAFSYLFVKRNGYKYLFAKKAEVFYKLPATLSDHEKQSIRFYKTQQLFVREFGKELVDKENYLSSFFIVRSFLMEVIKNPYLLLYTFMAAYLKVKSFWIKDLNNQWSVSESSKQVRGII